jgi:asparagine synthase (glutamine-hydrolysing)
MCGIAGIWSKAGLPISKERLEGMLFSLRHRGPDWQGIWNIHNLALGHRRLKILDLSDAANQPFTDGRDVLVFNGEIFNYRQLKKQLSDRFIFKTHSDTEVLFYCLQEGDENALQKIEGQFAFAFYRLSSHSLLIARDHAGICPLYTIETEDEFCFASEIKPLLSLKNGHLDRQAVVDYFTYRYNIQNGKTLFANITRFPPAHFLKIDLKAGQKTKKRYWGLKFQVFERPHNEVQAEFNNLFNTEVERQQLADVPVGLYLSGGIDSSALLSGFARSNSEINAFTLSFSRNDEDADRVKALANLHRFESHLLEFSENKFSVLEDAVFSLEEPFGDLIICANYLLARNASKAIKVVLSGEGGDESFCGYDHQRAFMRMSGIVADSVLYKFIALLLKFAPPQLITMFNAYPGGFGTEEQIKIRNVFAKIKDPCAAYINLVSLFEKEELSSLFSDTFKNSQVIAPDTEPLTKIFASENEIWQAVMRAEIEQLTLIINLLKQDRFGMRFSLEGRVPLVSKKILEFAATLPFRELFSPVNKRLLLDYAGNRIIKKKPFTMFADKLYLSSLINLWDKYVTKEMIMDTNIFSWQPIENLRHNLTKGYILSVKKAMAMLVFAVWLKSFRRYLK